MEVGEVESVVGADVSVVEVGDVDSVVGVDESAVEGEGDSEGNRNSGGHAPGTAAVECDAKTACLTGGIVPTGIVSTS